MKQPTYQLVYDAAQAGYTDWWFPATGLLLLVVFVALLVRARRLRLPARRAWIYYVGVPFLAFWLLAAFSGTYGQYAELRYRLASGKYTVVEGIVRGFKPSDWGDHVEESWSVESNGQTHIYHYVRSRLSPAFRHTAVHGGPIHEGLLVRIADVDGSIARLEIAR